MNPVEAFECPSCGHEVKPEALTGERGVQEAVCPSCGEAYTRTFAFYQEEWVFGLWRSKETGRVACSYYKTAFGAGAHDCE
jgi:Zn ribbon nucleic-acid-binding protein